MLTVSLFLFSYSQAEEQNSSQIYEETCVVCHGEGMHGAPRPGVKSDWQDRLSYGIEEIYLNTIEGMGVEMPPRGMCDDCSDEQLKLVVDFMLRDVK